MKDFLRVFLLIFAAFVFYFGLSKLKNISPYILSMAGIIISVTVIVGIIWLFRKRSHRLTKENEKKYSEEYKNQFRKN